MSVEEKAAVSSVRDSAQVLDKAQSVAMDLCVDNWLMALNPFSYVPHFLLHPSLIPRIPGDDKE